MKCVAKRQNLIIISKRRSVSEVVKMLRQEIFYLSGQGSERVCDCGGCSIALDPQSLIMIHDLQKTHLHCSLRSQIDRSGDTRRWLQRKAICINDNRLSTALATKIQSPCCFNDAAFVSIIWSITYGRAPVGFAVAIC